MAEARNWAADQALCNRVRPITYGRWHATTGYIHRPQPNIIYDGMRKVAVVETEDEADFIAVARTGWPAALGRISELERALKEVAEYSRDTYESPIDAYVECIRIAREALSE